jgi:hypothetical protein
VIEKTQKKQDLADAIERKKNEELRSYSSLMEVSENQKPSKPIIPKTLKP